MSIPYCATGDLQVRIKFPMDQLPPGTECYGVIITMGWFDPDLAKARKVKEVTVKLDRVQAGTVQHDRFEPGFRVPIITPILEALPEREAQVIQLYYVEELNLDEIGMVFGVGAARVCQIKASAHARLKKALARRLS